SRCVTLALGLAGLATLRASTSFPARRSPDLGTTSGTNGNSGQFVKQCVDANIQISPLTGANEIGSPHLLTGHVNVNDGTGYGNAPDRTQIHLTITNCPGALTASSCTTTGGTGSCSVTSPPRSPGITVLGASPPVSVLGVSPSRTTNGTAALSLHDALPILDANIQISPLTGANEIGSPHLLTGHVNVNDGTGYGNA